MTDELKTWIVRELIKADDWLDRDDPKMKDDYFLRQRQAWKIRRNVLKEIYGIVFGSTANPLTPEPKRLEDFINDLYSTNLGISRPELIEELEPTIRANWPTQPETPEPERGYTKKQIKDAIRSQAVTDSGYPPDDIPVAVQAHLETINDCLMVIDSLTQQNDTEAENNANSL